MAAIAKANSLTPLHSPSHRNDYPLIYSSVLPSFRDSRLSKLNVTLKRPRNASILPVIRAQSSPGPGESSRFRRRVPCINGKGIVHTAEIGLCVSISWGSGSIRIGEVLDRKALLKMGIRGVTVSDVRGFGAQGGSTERHGGSEFSEDKFVSKVKMEIVVSKDQVEAVIDKIIEEARTGEIGDGKIFLVPVSDVIRVRTGERGEKAERMTGGRADMSATALS
ncbi:Nitrogen regulatory protein PII - like 1 [Theobroma cacao]|nr:Nitrogen regulatory protein PII - like 1 [Theobroma cacao]